MKTVGKKFEKKKAENLNKGAVMALLKEKGIDFDEKAKLEDLKKLIPKE